MDYIRADEFHKKINKESLSGGGIKFTHPSKVETGHKCTVWDIMWGNYIVYMVAPVNYTR